MAAINKSLVLVPVTLCFLVALAAAQGDTTVALIVHGEARCKYNPSAVISNSTLHLMINGTIIPGTGTTTNTGQVVMTVNLTSPQQVESVTSNSSQQVLVVAPSNACGAPNIPAGSVVAAHLRVDPQLILDDETFRFKDQKLLGVNYVGDAAILAPQPTHAISATVGQFSCLLVVTIGR